MASLIVASSATVKHPGFKQEDEIRYIEAVPALSRKHYRPTDYGEAPYLKVGPAHRVFESSKQLEAKQAGAAKPQEQTHHVGG